MFGRLITYVLILGLPVTLWATEPPGDATAKEVKKFDGTWEATAAEANGESVPAALVKNIRMTVKDGAFKSAYVKLERYAGTFKIIEVRDKVAKVQHSYVSGPNKGKTIPGLAEWIDEGSFRLCYRIDGTERPTEFSGKKGSGQIVEVFKRVKE